MNNLHYLTLWEKQQCKCPFTYLFLWIDIWNVFRNVIDVAAIDSRNLHQHEYLERVKQYNSRVQHVLSVNRNALAGGLKSCLLRDVPHPEKILNSGVITDEERTLVCSLLVKRLHFYSLYFCRLTLHLQQHYMP